MASQSDELKAAGNAAFSAGQFTEAVEHFTAAIAVDPGNHVLYSNRSAAYSSMSQYQQALGDAQKVVELKPDWPKGYSRLGAAHFGLRQWDEAVEAYTKGLQVDPSSQQLKQGLEDVRAARAPQAQPRAAPAAGAGAGARNAGPVGQLVLLALHAFIVLAALASLQPLNRRLGWHAYFLGCRAVLVASAFKIYLRYGLPTLRPFPAAFTLWSRQAAASTELWHILVSTIMLQVPQLWMGIVPLAAQAAYPLLAALGARFGGHPLWHRYGGRAQALLEGNRARVSQLVATAEVAMAFQLLLAVPQRGLQGAMLAYVYWSNLRVRLFAPESRPYHQRTWSVINARVQPLLAAVPSLRRYLDAAMRWFNQPGQPQPHQQ